MRLPALLILLALSTTAAAVEITYPHKVALTRLGDCIRIINEREHQELLVTAANVVAILPGERDDNNAFTTMLLGAHTVRFQQRLNPADEVVRALVDLGFDYVVAISDRDHREPDYFLVNMRRVDLIERSRTDAERSDTVVNFSGGAPPGLAKVVINQSAKAYAAFREQATRAAR